MTTPYEYVEARRVLLDALTALGTHISSFILVGAQAVYVHAGDRTGIGGIPMTTDGDLMVDADLLAPQPDVTGVLQAAGFSTSHNPGSWLSRDGVAIDIMVCPYQSGRTGNNARSGRLPPHGNHLTRITAGLEPALVDNGPVTLVAIDPADQRRIDVNVAGPAALIVAKLTKIAERAAAAAAGQRDRTRDKDAVDILRLLVGVDLPDLIAGFGRHARTPESASTSEAAVRFLLEEQSRPGRNVLQRLIEQGLPSEPVAVAQWNHLTAQLFEGLAGTTF